MRIAPPPRIAPKPPTIDNAPKATVSSARAPPMPVRPLAIASQERLPILESPVAISSRPCTTMSIPREPSKEPMLPNFPSTEMAAVSSPIATPMPVRPFAKEPRSKEAKDWTASPSIFAASAKAIKATLVVRLTLTPSKNLRPATSSAIPTPTPVKPLAKEGRFNPESFTTASAKILTASARAIRATLALVKPLVLNDCKDFIMPDKPELSSIIMSLIAPSPTPIWTMLRAPSFSKEETRSVTAAAIATIDVTLIPSWKLSSDS